MITRFNPPFRPDTPPQWRGACAAVAGGGPNRATAIAVARLAVTIAGPTRGFTTLRLIDLVTATHRHLNELEMLEYGLQQLAHLEGELLPHAHWYRRPSECRCGGNAAGRGAAAPHRAADRADDRLPQA